MMTPAPIQPTANADPVPMKAATRDKVWFGSCAFALVLLGIFYFLIRRKFFEFSPETAAQFYLHIKAGVFIALVLALSRAIRVYLLGRIHDTISQYTLNRILRLIVVAVIIFIIITALFANLLTTIVSLGVVTVIVGFSLQTVLSSFIGWVYILVRNPYRVGDHIKIGEAEGDVIDVGYLDTTLWDFGTLPKATEPAGGQVIRFPNSKLLSTAIFNYSRPLLPYVWDDVVFKVGIESDLEFIIEMMQKAVAEELGEEQQARVQAGREMLATVNHLDVQESPTVTFRASERDWLEVTARYLIDPKEAGRIKSRLFKKLAARLSTEPSRVILPGKNL